MVKMLREHHHQKDNDDEVRNTVDDLHDTHHDGINRAADVTGNTAVDQADDEVDEHGCERDHQRDAAAFKGAQEKVTAEVIGAEIVYMVLSLMAGICTNCHEALVDFAKVLFAALKRREERHDDAGKDEEHDDEETHNGNFVFHQSADGVFPEGRARAGNALAASGVGTDPLKTAFIYLCHTQPSNFTRGSMRPYAISTTRFAIMRNAP